MLARVAVCLLFLATRAAMGVVAEHHDDLYPDGSADPTFELANYVVWSNQWQDFGHRPYGEFAVEYPPGSVLLGNLPYLVTAEDYRLAFLVQSVVLDALGLWAVWRIGRRHGSMWGVGAWLVLLPLLGPVAYTRLDLAVAACLAWSFERLDAGRWGWGGGLLGLGAVIKVTPILLLPAIVLAAPRRWRPAAAAAGVALVVAAPFLRDLPELWDQVVRYHLDRGVHAESLYGSLAIAAREVWSADVGLVSAFGATDIDTEFDTSLRTLSNLAAAGVVLDSAVAAVRRVARGDGTHVVLVTASALVLVTGVGRVFSPQYLVWLVAAGAALVAVAPTAFRWPVALVGVAAAGAHLIYPVLFYDYLDGDGMAVAVGIVRNLSLLAAGVLAVRAAHRWSGSGVPPVEEHEPLEVVDADVLVGPDR